MCEDVCVCVKMWERESLYLIYIYIYIYIFIYIYIYIQIMAASFMKNKDDYAYISLWANCPSNIQLQFFFTYAINQLQLILKF